MQSEKDPEIVLREIVHADARQIFAILRAAAERLPAWAPDEDAPPPLSIVQAAGLARMAACRRYPKWNNFRITTILLQSAACGPDGGPVKWFYVFQLAPEIDEGTFRGQVWELVLMDGFVVTPRFESKTDEN